MDKHIFLRYLENRRAPLGRQDEAVQIHKALCEAVPAFYQHLLVDALSHVSHKREVLVNLLETQIERQRLLEMLRQLQVDETLAVLDVIRDLRINRSRARELVLEALLGHEHLPTLAAVKRQRVAHLLRHVLGERTWSSIKRSLAHETSEGEVFLQREMLRYAWQGDRARLREILCFLSGVPFNVTQPDLAKVLAARLDINRGQGLPMQTLSGLRGSYHPKLSFRHVRRLAAQNVSYTHRDGQLTAALRERFSGKQNAIEQLASSEQASDGQKSKLEETTPSPESDKALPTLTGRVALVLDLSQSMVSSGERLYHPAALALVLTSLLRASLGEMQLYQLGGSADLATTELPRPEGVADLAQGLLKAASARAQIVLLITDGYENFRQGDVALVVQGLRHAGYNAPIYQVVPVYAQAEDLSFRRLSENIPLLPLGHEQEVREILARILLATADEQLTEQELHQLQGLLVVR